MNNNFESDSANFTEFKNEEVFPNNKIKYLIKVTYALSRLTIYKVETADIYHWVGKLVLNSIEKIEDIRYSTWSQERENFWIDSGCKIYEREDW